MYKTAKAIAALSVISLLLVPIQAEAGGWAKSNKGKFVQAIDVPQEPSQEAKRASAQKSSDEKNTTLPPGITEDSLYRIYTIIYNKAISDNRSLSPELADYITRCIMQSCAEENVDPLLVCALISQESSFNPNAESPAGACSLGQLMPDTAAGLGVNPWDIAENILGTVRYLKAQASRFSDAGVWQITYTLAAYNAGPNAVLRYGGVPPYRETQNYVRAIANGYYELRQQYDQ